jgi:hypothetical protein
VGAVENWNSSVCTETGWMVEVRFLTVQDFSLLHSVQINSFLERDKADDTAPSSAEIKNGGAIPTLSNTSIRHSTQLIN